MAALSAELVSLLEACKAEPDEEAPRLVLADWLEEHGEDDRAEFVRVQARSAELPEYDPEVVALAVRAGQLLRRHRDAWLGERKEDGESVLFDRGLLSASLASGLDVPRVLHL